MLTSRKIFRYIWRIDAVLILVAAGAATLVISSSLLEDFGRRPARQSDTGIPVVAPEENVHPRLGHAEVVPGTDVMRATLTLESEGSGLSKVSGYGSSGGNTETRNILFIEGGQKAAHWLLPDNDHVIEGNIDVKDEEDKKTLATVVLVKPKDSTSENAPERLLLFDPSGKTVVEVASNATDIHLAKVSSGELTILFERNRRLVLAAFDAVSLAKRSEHEIEIPLLK